MRNTTLDFFKFLAAFLVIFIHVDPIFEGQAFLLVFSRLAVPFFLVITGYYYPTMVERNKEGVYLKKITKLAVFPAFLYALVVYKMLADLTTKDLVYWLGLNVMPFGNHLWYLYAVIYVLMIMKMAKSLMRPTRAMVCSVLLIGVNYVLSFQENFYLYRNFLFTGMPYFLLGVFLWHKRDRIQMMRMSWGKFLGVFSVLLIMLMLEYQLYWTLDCCPEREHYLMVYPICSWIFCFAINRPNVNNVFSVLGLKYCTFIYIYHFLVLIVLERMIQIVPALECFNSIRNTLIFPVVILVITLGVAYVCKAVKLRMRKMIG